MHRIIDWIRRRCPVCVTPKAPHDYVGTYDASIFEIEDFLIENDFVPNPVSYVSYKENVSHEKATWAWRTSPFAERQYHVVLFKRQQGIDIYCHEEYNWIRHPIKHLRQENIDSPAGIGWMSSLLQDSTINQRAVD